ncbi:hypothetical protein [Lentibacillus juripiscarius]|uniref:Uncharacterized protein n=1 Tax=Lentibacillus juripiscarius TaxID=257446 RepID=A0ABW5V2M4_9BACI
MWSMLLDRIPDVWVFLNALFVFIIPYTIYKVNQKLHQHGDPPWKKENKG